MPAKGSKKDSTEQNEQTIEGQEFSSLQDVAEKLSADFNLKFGKIEKVLETITAAVPTLVADAESRKRPFEPHYESPQTRSKASKTSKQPAAAQGSASFIEQNDNSNVNNQRDRHHQAADAQDISLQARSHSAIFQPYVNNNNNIPTWVMEEAHNIAPSAPLSNFPMSTRDFRGNESLDAQVSQILASTASQLTKGNQVQGFFPSKYTRRNPEARKPAANFVSVQDYLWGITRMLRDPEVPNHIKPYLYLHLEEILEDARDYEWHGAVRLWSEECFSMVAEGRLDWADKAKVQLLRMSMSRTSTARLNNTRDHPNRPRQNSQAQGHDQGKGGPPCPDYNTIQGCGFPSGHMVAGKRMIHVCAYCLSNTSSFNTHSEAVCRNKQRHANYHF